MRKRQVGLVRLGRGGRPARGGARLLADWLAAPLTDVAAIAARQDAIEYLTNEVRLREDIRVTLKAAPDLERALRLETPA